MTTNRRRPGVTLTEVLIATGIMAVGMLAILALYPIGAVNMARAINQDRTATHAMNSDNLFRVHWKNAWIERDPGTGVPTGTVSQNTEAAYQNSAEPMLPLLEAHPVYGHVLGDWRLPTAPLPPPNWKYPNPNTEPSYPVLVDPIGWQNKAGSADQGFIAGDRLLPVRTTLRAAHHQGLNPPPPNTYVRVAPDPYADDATRSAQIAFFSSSYPLTFLTAMSPNPPVPPAPWQWGASIPAIVRNTTLLDDMTFDAAGEPAAFTGQLERGGRYNVSWLIQRASNATQSEVKIHVLAFSGRSPTDTTALEYPYPFLVIDPKVIQLNVASQAAPPIKKGGFIALSYQVPRPAGTLPANSSYPTFDFYRVVSVNDDSGNYYVELETPVKQPSGVIPIRQMAVVFDNLFEVYDRGVVSASGNVKP